jgi:hypothetical protein
MTTMSFGETVRKLLDGKNFATIATIMPDGAPQSSVVWIHTTPSRSAAPPN